MKKNKLKWNIFLFSIVFILFFLKTKFTGNFGRVSYGPVSFKETIDKIPEMLVFSIIALIIFNLIYRETRKSDEKSIEEARKQIEEKEKQKHQEKDVRKDNGDQGEETT
jgi:hypothetical protein